MMMMLMIKIRKMMMRRRKVMIKMMIKMMKKKMTMTKMMMKGTTKAERRPSSVGERGVGGNEREGMLEEWLVWMTVTPSVGAKNSVCQ